MTISPELDAMLRKQTKLAVAYMLPLARQRYEQGVPVERFVERVCAGAAFGHSLVANDPTATEAECESSQHSLRCTLDAVAEVISIVWGVSATVLEIPHSEHAT